MNNWKQVQRLYGNRIFKDQGFPYKYSGTLPQHLIDMVNAMPLPGPRGDKSVEEVKAEHKWYWNTLQERMRENQQ